MTDCIPNFIPSSEACVLPSGNEQKSRLTIGGTLFRSKDVGESTNSISISAVLGGDIGNGFTYVSLSVFVNNLFVTSHNVSQVQDIGSPEWQDNGIKTMRDAIDSGAGTPPLSDYITIPNIDVESGWTSADDADHLSEFSNTFLTGGEGLSATPSQPALDAIRTGAAFTLININDSEKYTNDGTFQNIGEVRYWNGGCWKAFDPINPVSSCFDGSPPTCP